MQYRLVRKGKASQSGSFLHLLYPTSSTQPSKQTCKYPTRILEQADIDLLKVSKEVTVNEDLIAWYRGSIGKYYTARLCNTGRGKFSDPAKIPARAVRSVQIANSVLRRVPPELQVMILDELLNSDDSVLDTVSRGYLWSKTRRCPEYWLLEKNNNAPIFAERFFTKQSFHFDDRALKQADCFQHSQCALCRFSSNAGPILLPRIRKLEISSNMASGIALSECCRTFPALAAILTRYDSIKREKWLDTVEVLDMHLGSHATYSDPGLRAKVKVKLCSPAAPVSFQV